MKFIRNLVFITVIAFIAFYFLETRDSSPNELVDHISNIVKEKEYVLETKVAPPDIQKKSPLIDNLFSLIGQTTDDLKHKYGEPIRKDPSSYGYDWWIYTNYHNEYIQIGVQNSKVETIFATGNNIDILPVSIGQSYRSLNELYSFEDEVTYSDGMSSYTFRLSDTDKNMRPLVKNNDHIFAQFYFDTFTNELSSIRVLTANILLSHRPYEVEYRGKLPSEPNLLEDEWKLVESGMEQQIFDITNILRHQHQLQPLNWDDSVSDVAFAHSKDMQTNNYFSHDSLNGDGLKERLAVQDVFYVAAGENIAAGYIDAPAAMVGWLNSEGHREALFKDDYTHLGVGVYRFYYTQNFLARP